MIAITDTELAILLNIIKQHVPASQVVAFGSRTKGNHRPSSDLDLAVKHTSSQLSQIWAMKHACMESDLPYKVDICDFHSISPVFQGLIDAHHVVIYQPEDKDHQLLGSR